MGKINLLLIIIFSQGIVFSINFLDHENIAFADFPNYYECKKNFCLFFRDELLYSLNCAVYKEGKQFRNISDGN